MIIKIRSKEELHGRSSSFDLHVLNVDRFGVFQ